MLTRQALQEKIAGGVHILDGATGSNLRNSGMPKGCCSEEWILANPEPLVALQRAYAEAGCQIIYAPTFQAQPIALKRVGLDGQTEAINEALVALSRSAAPGCLIAGDLTTLANFCDSWDAEAFDLMEYAVCAVRYGLVAEYASRADDADRGFAALHGAHLYRRGVCTEQYVGVLLDEERILHIACGVLGREVQGREYVPVVLDFGAFGDGIAQTREDLDDLVSHERYGVSRSYVVGRAGTGHGLEVGGFGDGGLQGVDTLLRGGFEGVETLPYFAFVFGGDALELLHQGVQLAFLAEDLDAELFEFGGCFRFELFDTSEEFIDFVDHILFVFLFSLLLKCSAPHVTCKVIKKLRYVA